MASVSKSTQQKPWSINDVFLLKTLWGSASGPVGPSRVTLAPSCDHGGPSGPSWPSGESFQDPLGR
eukprot:2862745-Pyramimonas_sp.AAC.1